METPICDICADPQKDKFMYKLQCGHAFHYECIMKSFQCDRKTNTNQCPLCRQTHGLLPIVNALPRLIYGIHYCGYPPPPKPEEIRCVEILKSGKRKGDVCGSRCMIGMNMCKRHHKSVIKDPLIKDPVKKVKKQKQKVKVLKLGDALEQVQLEQALETTSQTNTSNQNTVST